MQRSRFKYEVLLLALLFFDSAAADLFTGDFTGSLDGKIYRLSISAYAGRLYEGEFITGGKKLPFNARRFGDRIAGQIGIADSGFGFLARVQNGGLLLQAEDGRVILFRRNSVVGGGVEAVGVD